MKKIKSFKIFENNSITNQFVKNLIDDLLVDLKDLNDNFSWKLYFGSSSTGIFRSDSEDYLDKKFINCLLEIRCYDNVEFDGSATDILKSTKKDWKQIISRMIVVLNLEGISVYDQVESLTRAVPDKINPKSHAEVVQNPHTFEVTETYMSKDFELKFD